MLTMYTAYTLEADDVEYAVSEILEQLQLEKKLKKYAAGLIFCHTDFTDSGVAQAVAEKMPFDVIGTTFVAEMVPEMDDTLMLVLHLFTSDDVEIDALKIDQMEKGAAAQAFNEAAAKHALPASLMLAYMPLLMPRSVESLLEELDVASGNVPIYGSLAFDFSSDYSLWTMLFNGESSREFITALVFFGDMQPQFYSSTLSNKYVQTHKSIITKSEGNLLMEIDGKPYIEYLVNNGFDRNVTLAEFGSSPMLIDFGDGTPPVPRGLIRITPEGYAILAGEVPEGAQISLGALDYTYVLRVTEEVMQAAVKSDNRGPMIVHPCATHYFIMGAGVQTQKDVILQNVFTDHPYSVGYSGGEICPVYKPDGTTKNRFFNYTIVLCVL